MTWTAWLTLIIGVLAVYSWWGTIAYELIIEEWARDTKNPLWRLLAAIFWPVTVSIIFFDAVSYSIIRSLKEIIDYYDGKGNEDENK